MIAFLPPDADVIASSEIATVESYYDRFADPCCPLRSVDPGFRARQIQRCLATIDAYRTQREYFARIKP